jgi:superfamily II DNA or RNA helicase
MKTTHRNHQREPIELILDQISSQESSSGQVSLPTGTGKTRVQVSVHIGVMQKNIQENKLGIHVIAAHRLALCNQLLNEFIPEVIHNKIPTNVLFVGSDRFPEDSIYEKFKEQNLSKYHMEFTSTTRQDEIQIAYQTAKYQNRHLIIVSTYHSFNRLTVLPKIDICTYDEAHVLVGESFLENIKEVLPQISHNYFFTATRKVQGTIGGMNDEEIFGKVIYQKSPREMIELGEIVAPKFHTISPIDDGDFDNHSMLVKTIIQGFKEHKNKIKSDSYSPEKIGAKLLITTTGNLEMVELISDKSFIEFCTNNSINMFSYSSEYGCRYNFQKNARNFVMDKMQSLPDDADAILLHIDILTEGIDLPSITGIMPFRELNTIKLLQSLGRGSRLFKGDRTRLYSGEILPKELNKFIKPSCWILIPRFFRSLGDSDAMKSVLKTIINTYEIPIEEYVVENNYVAVSDEDVDRITDRDKSDKKDEETDLYNIYETIFVEHIREWHQTPFWVSQSIDLFKGN